MIEDFSTASNREWRFFTDTVMGGVSSGKAEFLNENGTSFVRLSGDVSTANNGGFIQVRRELSGGLPAGAQGIRLLVRGNEQRYFVHLRTSGTLLPWQYYQAPFNASGDWRGVTIPLGQFKASSKMLRSTPKPGSVSSIAIVAFGRDHAASVDVSEIEAY